MSHHATPPHFFPLQWRADGSAFHGSGFSDNTVYEFHYVLGRLQALCLSPAIRKLKKKNAHNENRCSLFVIIQCGNVCQI